MIGFLIGLVVGAIAWHFAGRYLIDRIAVLIASKP